MKVQQWDTYEIVLNSEREYENPFLEVDLSAVLIHEETGRSLKVNGFYDGDAAWRIRFLLLEKGVWSYATSSSDPGLDGKEGRITCVDARDAWLHGPLTCKGHHFFHADGTPRFIISTRISCHLSPPDVWRKAVEYLKAHGINRIFFMMGGISGTTGRLFEEGPDFRRYTIESFKAMDTFIDALRHENIIASPYFYYFNDGLQCEMTASEDKAYIKYGMARFGAYANVMPVLSNEVETKYLRDRMKSESYDLRVYEWANEMGKYMDELAVFGTPVTVHNPAEHFNACNPGFYTLLKDWPFPWAKCMLRQIQIGALGAVPELRDDVHESARASFNARGYARHNELLAALRRFGIPVVNEEPGYEMAGYISSDLSHYDPRSWNSQTPETIIPTFWTAFTAGAYAMWGHFDTYETGDPYPGIKRTITPKYLRILQDFAAGLRFWEMEPRNEAVSAGEVIIEGAAYRTNYCLAKEGEVYVVFSLNGGAVDISLAPAARYRVEQLDPRTGIRTGIGTLDGGKQTVSMEGKEQVLILIKD